MPCTRLFDVLDTAADQVMPLRVLMCQMLRGQHQETQADSVGSNNVTERAVSRPVNFDTDTGSNVHKHTGNELNELILQHPFMG